MFQETIHRLTTSLQETRMERWGHQLGVCKRGKEVHGQVQWIEWWSTKDVSLPEPVNVILFGKGLYRCTELKKLEIKRSSWTSGWLQIQ